MKIAGGRRKDTVNLGLFETWCSVQGNHQLASVDSSCSLAATVLAHSKSERAETFHLLLSLPPPPHPIWWVAMVGGGRLTCSPSSFSSSLKTGPCITTELYECSTFSPATGMGLPSPSVFLCYIFFLPHAAKNMDQPNLADSPLMKAAVAALVPYAMLARCLSPRWTDESCLTKKCRKAYTEFQATE